MVEKDSAEMNENRQVEKAVVSGYLPEVYREFHKRFSGVSEAIDNLAQICQNAGPLDKTTSELIKLGIAVGINSEGAVRSHARRALEEGVSADKIRQAVILAFTTAGFPHTIAAYKWVEEVLQKNSPGN